MNRYLQFAVFAVGLAVVCWIGSGYLSSNPLALAITVVIGAFYLIGARELWHFDQATTGLGAALSNAHVAPVDLKGWLVRLPASLQNPVRLRIEGERVGLPGPTLTPYLAGLLVLLGMLGTFLGMVVTLNGTGAALDSATDIDSIRASLSAPVKGLGLAFGTSVAGIAASAMLGLLSALCRRDRLLAAHRLDTAIATSLREFSGAQRREESFRLLQRQAEVVEVVPQLADRLEAMLAALEQQSQALNDRLVAGQDSFHGKAESAYTALAASVDRSLRESLVESARAAGATIQPVVEATMAGIARETAALHTDVARTVQGQLEGLSGRFEVTTAAVADNWRAALEDHRRISDSLSGDTRQALAIAAANFEQHGASLVRTIGEANDAGRAALVEQDAARLSAWADSMETMASSLGREWQQAGADAAVRQQEIARVMADTSRDVAAQIEAQAKATISEVARLVQVAAEAPRAAADVIASLREQLSDSMARDNAMLSERARILETLDTLLGAVNHSSNEQKAAVESLVAASADALARATSQFARTLDSETGKLDAVSAQITSSAVEVASLGETFGFAVERFGESSERLGAQLERIEGALGRTIVRSDEQLAYYVAQAREVIDLSLMSQKQIVEDLEALAARQERKPPSAAQGAATGRA